MKVRDYVIFGSNASATLGVASEDNFVWEYNAQQFFEVDAQSAIELLELGVFADNAAGRVQVRNKDNQEWIPDGFIVLGASVGKNCTELPYTRRPDFSQILAPVTPDGGRKLSPTLKLPTGDRLFIAKKNAAVAATNSVSVSLVVGLVRKWVAQNPVDVDATEGFAKTFGGLESNAQLWHSNGSISGAAANDWFDLISLTLLKSELYAFNSFGIYYPAGLSAGEVDKIRIFIDEQIEYNKYPGPPGGALTTEGSSDLGNIAPFNDGFYFPQGTLSETNDAYPLPRPLIFDKPLVVKKTTNKRLQLQAKGSAAFGTTDTPVFARLRGMRYKI